MLSAQSFCFLNVNTYPPCDHILQEHPTKEMTGSGTTALFQFFTGTLIFLQLFIDHELLGLSWFNFFFFFLSVRC